MNITIAGAGMSSRDDGIFLFYLRQAEVRNFPISD